jgi:hypothetical protein
VSGWNFPEAKPNHSFPDFDLRALRLAFVCSLALLPLHHSIMAKYVVFVNCPSNLDNGDGLTCLYVICPTQKTARRAGETIVDSFDIFFVVVACFWKAFS